MGVHCVCTVLLFDETSKTNLSFGVAADGFERQGSQFFIFGPLYKPFGRGLSVFHAIGGHFFRHIVAITWAILEQSGQKFVDP